jgi:hypothetical protein
VAAARAFVEFLEHAWAESGSSSAQQPSATRSHETKRGVRR